MFYFCRWWAIFNIWGGILWVLSVVNILLLSLMSNIQYTRRVLLVLWVVNVLLLSLMSNIQYTRRVLLVLWVVNVLLLSLMSNIQYTRRVLLVLWVVNVLLLSLMSNIQYTRRVLLVLWVANVLLKSLIEHAWEIIWGGILSSECGKCFTFVVGEQYSIYEVGFCEFWVWLMFCFCHWWAIFNIRGGFC